MKNSIILCVAILFAVAPAPPTHAGELEEPNQIDISIRHKVIDIGSVKPVESAVLIYSKNRSTWRVAAHRVGVNYGFYKAGVQDIIACSDIIAIEVSLGGKTETVTPSSCNEL